MLPAEICIMSDSVNLFCIAWNTDKLSKTRQQPWHLLSSVTVRYKQRMKQIQSWPPQRFSVSTQYMQENVPTWTENRLWRAVIWVCEGHAAGWPFSLGFVLHLLITWPFMLLWQTWLTFMSGSCCPEGMLGKEEHMVSQKLYMLYRRVWEILVLTKASYFSLRSLLRIRLNKRV